MRNGGGDVSIYHDEQGTNRATFEDTLQIHQSINKAILKNLSVCLSVHPCGANFCLVVVWWWWWWCRPAKYMYM